ncbi:L-aspartate oxidase [Ectocarpus siliculosus]|uniref:L-aspartate oxidase n=1 Tax=Ectocarpus siliculosus TaxID=2880 RepID=D8LN62_ECTSI|nr:L-aspartate oxidase [Ectocarpus siliculosus]|eukprot:CBN74825.1 L-aspartate oxidase [Ectocarpus siliculosus]
MSTSRAILRLASRGPSGGGRRRVLTATATSGAQRQVERGSAHPAAGGSAAGAGASYGSVSRNATAGSAAVGRCGVATNGNNRFFSLSTAAAAPSAARAPTPTPTPVLASRSPASATEFDTDLLVVGCGIAGASAALQAARLGMTVTMLSSARNVDDCNSFWAQGGIIYKAEDDSPDLLASDVHTAGAGLCNDPAVMKLAEEGPGRVEQMLLRGSSEVPFDRDADGRLALCLEASHNRARIIHWRDETGKAITTSVQAAAAQHPNIRVMTSTTAVDLALAAGQCVGAHVLVEDSGMNDGSGMGRGGGYHLETIRAPATVLATGGLGDLYAHTSNPASAKGAGFAMALRAGAVLSGMEYVQFHPTTLHIPGQRSFLLTEALRGEGARLVDRRGRCFAKNYHPDGELAPRDVVSRTILSEMRLQGAPHMYLDISHRPADWIRGRFPSIYEHCMRQGLDMTVQPLPVVPAAHYFCGGVATDLTGRTTVPGLFAAGEVACTGLHGANRLASTSLLEGLVWGCSIADHLADRGSKDSKDGLAASADMGALAPPRVPGTAAGGGGPVASAKALSSAWKDLRTILWEDVGAVRRSSSLREGAQLLSDLADRCSRLYDTSALCPETVELRNGVQTGAMIAAAAASNECSVGTHFVEEEDEEDDHGQARA